jgi:nicotinamide mononucleotide transporter
MWEDIINYAVHIDHLELSGLIFGLLAVWFLIKQNIWTWPTGIIYVLISFVIFWNIQLYGDFLLHIFFLILNIYGWYYWVKGDTSSPTDLSVSTFGLKQNISLLLITGLGIFIFGFFLEKLPYFITGMVPASLPYWDATTSILSVTGMWLTTRKKIENWYYWFAVDLLACGIYIYKGIYFYAFLYGVYVFMAVWGYMEWRKSFIKQKMLS